MKTVLLTLLVGFLLSGPQLLAQDSSGTTSHASSVSETPETTTNATSVSAATSTQRVPA
ncbi:hypothetical protein [Spirosoma montaniterrae]|uniref:hypothetical protein n=1 Tax=Spirosoma montaniterrae TaxID=1178516 RepID=UPI0012FBE1FE|nr:hypothetical protein [Spirosoma montaniterrae]